MPKQFIEMPENHERPDRGPPQVESRLVGLAVCAALRAALPSNTPVDSSSESMGGVASFFQAVAAAGRSPLAGADIGLRETGS